MKKKHLMWMATATMLLAASSCSQEENITPSSSSGEMTTFKVKLEGNAQSRTAGDGKTVKNLYYEVYQGEGNTKKKVLDNLGEGANADAVEITDGLAMVEMPLMKGEKYDLIFWAQAEGAIYNANDLQQISIDYTPTTLKSNKEAYDAFFYGKTGFQVSGNVETIELRRPFGQLNIGTTYNEEKKNPGDWQVAINMTDGDLPPVTESEIKVTGLANRFNALTHEAYVEKNTEVGQVIFGMAELIGMNLTEKKYSGERFEIKKSETEKQSYQNLSMNYLLVPSYKNPETEEWKHQGNVDITASFKRGANDLFSIDIPNVPVQRNWRTNIIGELLAADKTFEVVIVPDFDGTEIYPDELKEELYMAAAIGGEVTLTNDVVLPTPLNVQYDMTINLNGHTISNTTDFWKDTDDINDWSLISVQNGSTLTIKGEGELKAKENDCYAVDVRDGSTLNIEGGKYVGNISAVYVYSGVANLKGGEFSIQQLASGNSYALTLNCLDDNYKNETAKIVVTGGKFYNFNPTDCAAEGAGTNFVPEGYEAKTSGEWTTVIGEVVDYVEFEDHAEVYTAEGLLTWLNTVTTEVGKEDFEVKLQDDIVMPKNTIVWNEQTGKYEFTDTEITFDATTGEPSGSNWITLNGSDINELADGFKGKIDGNGNTISGLVIKKESDYTGLVGFMYDGAEIKNLTIENAVIYGGDNTGVIGGRSQNGNLIENIHVVNSLIHGTNNVGGIVGRNYRREKDGSYDEKIAYVKDCSTDASTKIIATGNSAGGICGENNGAVIVNCVNNADVTGKSNVGGIVGYCRDYWADKNDPNGTVADAYVIACSSTAEAQLTATDGCVGGIMGQGLADVSNHKYTWNFAVACHSASDLSGTDCGSIVGDINTRTKIVGCWAVKKDNVNNLVGSHSSNVVNEKSGHYTAANEITEEIVNEMNTAISGFNSTNAEQIKCEYKWEWVSGEWPKLVPQASND